LDINFWGIFLGKYTEQEKLLAVEDYCTGQSGLRITAQRHNVDVSSLRQWVAAYRVFGAMGIKEKKRAFYSVEFKLTVLRRVRLEKLSYRQAAALFDVRRFDIIGHWERQYAEGGLDALSSGSTIPCKQMTKPLLPQPDPPLLNDETRTRQELLDEVNYLRMENAYLKKLDALVQAKKQVAQKKKRK
jgi:transposase